MLHLQSYANINNFIIRMSSLVQIEASGKAILPLNRICIQSISLV